MAREGMVDEAAEEIQQAEQDSTSKHVAKEALYDTSQLLHEVAASLYKTKARICKASSHHEAKANEVLGEGEANEH